MRDVHKLSEFVLQDIVFDRFCFGGEEFPAGEFADPARVKDLIGPYRISVEYFDGSMKRVSRAAKPGRYAAVVHITHAGGTSRRFITLFRFAEGFCIPAWLENPEGKKRWEPLDIRQLPVRISMPAIAGLKLDRARVRRHRDELDAFLTSRFLVSLEHDRRGASLLAALDGAQDGDVPARILERRWWVKLKRKYYGLEKRYGELVVGPRKIIGRPARELSGGRPGDAGLKPEFFKEFDAVCRRWAAETGRGFGICVARRGRKVFEKGYGRLGGGGAGAAVTAATRVNIASATKMLSVILMLQFVDQGYIKLTDTVEKFVPAFRGRKVQRKITIHELYDMTCGYAAHWHDELSDLEEMAADLYPALDPGKRVVYQGVGHSVGSKIMEYMTGKALPDLFQEMLFGPMGCAGASSELSAAGAVVSADELLRIGQMLLNGGSYGRWRFFEPETLSQIYLPPRLERSGPQKEVRWAMGTKIFDSDGLSGRAFGHSGAMGAFMFIDPVHELVLASVSTEEGRDYHAWRGRVFGTVLKNIV